MDKETKKTKKAKTSWIEIIALDTRTREVKILGTADAELCAEIETSLSWTGRA